MENIPVTTYRGFSAVSGETTFTQDMADIKNGKHAKLIIKIASLVAQGKVEEANHVKKQLPFRTLTANYRERRLAPSITRYNPVITLDIDDLEQPVVCQPRLGHGHLVERDRPAGLDRVDVDGGDRRRAHQTIVNLHGSRTSADYCRPLSRFRFA